MTIVGDGTSSVPLARKSRAETRAEAVLSRRSRTVLGLLLGAVALTVGWWWSHPTVYGGIVSGFTTYPEEVTPVYVVMLGPPEDDRVEVISATPLVRVFGGEASAEVLLCDGARIGVLYGDDAEQPCFGPGSERADDRWDQVVLKVTPQAAGTIVVVDGIDLTYSTGLQRGTAHTGSAGVIVFPQS